MFFKKKQSIVSNDQSALPPACSHKYKDFPWYIKATLDESTKRYTISIYEPYVCILCKHRYDHLLECFHGYGKQNYKNDIIKCENSYPQIRGRAEVEDKITDMKLLDPYYLDAYYKLYPEQKKEKS